MLPSMTQHCILNQKLAYLKPTNHGLPNEVKLSKSADRKPLVQIQTEIYCTCMKLCLTQLDFPEDLTP